MARPRPRPRPERRRGSQPEPQPHLLVRGLTHAEAGVGAGVAGVAGRGGGGSPDAAAAAGRGGGREGGGGLAHDRRGAVAEAEVEAVVDDGAAAALAWGSLVVVGGGGPAQGLAGARVPQLVRLVPPRGAVAEGVLEWGGRARGEGRVQPERVPVDGQVGPAGARRVERGAAALRAGVARDLPMVVVVVVHAFFLATDRVCGAVLALPEVPVTPEAAEDAVVTVMGWAGLDAAQHHAGCRDFLNLSGGRRGDVIVCSWWSTVVGWCWTRYASWLCW